MIETIPNVVDSAFLYFHSRRSCGDELAPFIDEYWCLGHRIFQLKRPRYMLKP